VTDRFDRIVAALLAGVVLTCAGAALALRPAPLPAADGARWIELARRSDAESPVFHRSWDVDAIEAGADHLAAGAPIPPLRRGDRLVISGWAVDPGLRQTAAGVAFRVDGGSWHSARYQLARPDVAAALSLPSLADCGYRIDVPTGALGPGPHELQLATAGSHQLLPMTPTLRFEITAP
jgi:hypothetical protein